MERRNNIELALALISLAAPVIVVTVAAPAALAQDEASGPLGDGLVGAPSPASRAPASGSSDDTGGGWSSGPDPGSAWFRVDTDRLGTQLWFGATHTIGDLHIASDIYVMGTLARLDIGPALTFGDLALTPMIGLGFDFDSQGLAALVAPQLFTVYSKGDLYIESWIQVSVSSLFVDGVANELHTRNFILYGLSDWLQVGPELDITMNLGESVADAGDSGLTSMPIGAIAGLDYGTNNKLLVFLGYETKAAPNAGVVSGRFTFIRSW